MDASRIKQGSARYAGLALALAAASFSCTDGATTRQASSFRIALERDGSGAADYLLDFGVVALGNSEEVIVLVTNAGNAPLVIAGDELGGTFAHDLPAPSLTIGVGATVPLTFTFAPENEAGSFEAIAELLTNEGDGSAHTVRLIGVGMQALLTCTPTSLDFGVVPRGAARTMRTSCHNPLPIPVEIHMERVGGTNAEAFAAEIAGDGIVPGGAAIEVELRFESRSLGMNEARLTLADRAGSPLASLPLSALAIEGNLYAEPTGCLDFSFVQVGEEIIRSFGLRAVGGSSLMVGSVSIDAGPFAAITELPLDLPADGDPRELAIAFRPQENGTQSVAIEVEVIDGDAAQTVTLCAEGIGVGGGPSIACMPASADFGQVAVGMSSKRSFSCVLDTGPEAAEPSAPVAIDTLRSSNLAFEPKILNLDGSRGPKAEGYADGETFAVEIEYTPSTERLDRGSITLFARGAASALEVPVVGQGRELEPCDFSIEPPRLSFGSVDRGVERPLTFTIRNHLSTSCLIGDLRLTDESDPSFAVAPLHGVELEGQQTLEVEVTFAPTRNGPLLRGAVEFQISNPARRFQRVELSGSSGETCLLLEPAEVDFGKVAPGCASRDVTVSVMNICSEPATILGVTVEGSAKEHFQIHQHPVLPAVLRTNERREFKVAFLPKTAGIRQGTVAIELEGSEPYRANLQGEAIFAPKQTDRFDRSSVPKADILWVIDNSGSFEESQEVISRNLPAFLAEADAQNVDYHIAVTTSGITPREGCPGGADGGENGRFFPIDGSHPRILTKDTKDIATHWANNVRVGTCHSEEKYLEAAYRALSKPLIEEAKDSRYSSQYSDGNAGFLRKDASLSIILVGNESDQSIRFDPEDDDYLWYFGQAAGSSKLLRIHGIVGLKSTESAERCERDWGGTEGADRIRNLIDKTGGTWINICTPLDDDEAWRSGLRQMSEGAFGVPRRFYLRGSPGDSNGDGWIDEGDIDVAVDGLSWPSRSATQEERWTYDPLSNAIDFAPRFIPAPEAEITAVYSVGCGLP